MYLSDVFWVGVFVLVVIAMGYGFKKLIQFARHQESLDKRTPEEKAFAMQYGILLILAIIALRGR